MGWTFKNGSVSNRTKIALENRPRVEVGHRYIMALAWAPAKCATGDKPESAHWVGLGEGSLLPFDHGIIGEGESEGRTQNAAPTERLTGGVGGMSVEDAVAGKGADALKHKLQAVSPFSKKLQPTSSAGSACS